MMKKAICAALVLVFALWCGAAMAQELPSIEVFSPGLVRLAALERTHSPVSAQASVSIDKAAYARDLSVLGDMLEGMTIAYTGNDEETLSFTRNGELLGVWQVPENKTLDALEEKYLGLAILERVPLTDIAEWLEGLAAGDEVALGFCVTQPFALERTMSDDGTRLTKIAVSGAIGREGEASWQVKGFLRQPGGRAPKDTFELTITQDEDNFIELLYSALRENEVTRKNKEGVMSVRTTLKAAGQLAGYGVSSRLNVTAKNKWTADGEALSERVSVTATLAHQDRTPGRRMQRLNEVEGESKHVLRLTTHESGDDAIDLTDAITLKLVMDSNTVLSAGAQVAIRVGGEAEKSEMQAQMMTQETAKELAEKIYRQMDEKERETIRKGL